jgi:leucyl aminopeptidase
MKVEVTARRVAEVPADALLIPLWQTPRVPRFLADLDRALGGSIRRMLDQGDFKGKAGEVVVLPSSGKVRTRRIVLLGLGAEGTVGAEGFRRAAGLGVHALMGRKGRTGALVVPRTRRVSDSDAGQALAEGGTLGGYRFDRYRTSNELPRAPDSLTLIADGRDRAVLRRGAKVGTILGESANLARDLSNEPGSVHTPAWLATRARALGKDVGARVRVLGPTELRREKMAGILTVGRGSEHPPRLIEFDYKPATVRRGSPTVALVGKGITFDTGGISLKPAATMAEMKHDMSGGAAVFGAVRAAALLGLPLHVVGLVAAAENKPGSRAYLPGDVIRSASGRTIEVLNTDAEGRIVMADALHRATSFKPDAIIDLATLTGACVVALGTHCSAAMGNDDGLLQRVRDAGERSGERIWPLPLWDEYKEQVQGEVGDLKNTSGREGATITAGAFLSHFVGESPWIHLDIAGTAFTKKALPYCPVGATGVGVRLLVEMMRAWTSRS